MNRLRTAAAGLALLAGACAPATAQPDAPAPAARYVFYLHGRIVEEQGRRPTDPAYGTYEYDAILDSLRRAGFTVLSEQRPPGVAIDTFVNRVVGQVDSLLRLGVAPQAITVIGFSRGGAIAILASSRLRNPAIAFVFMGACGTWAFERDDIRPAGRLLSIYETSDTLGVSCAPLFARATPGSERREVAVSLGLGHGTFYQPRAEWLRPAIEWARGDGAATEASALTIGETFTLQSRVLGETRRINVYLPPGYADSSEPRLPVLYMPDGGMQEDFLHVAGLVQVSVGNGTMRPFLLVGIENTARRRDLTGPTEREDDRKIAPVVGGSAAFRRFIRTELMPAVQVRYRTTDETAIVGESLAGLFVVETFLLEPDLFDGYLAFDPSLWWNGGALVERAVERLPATAGRSLYLASSSQDQILAGTRKLAGILAAHAPAGTTWHFEPMPEETHATIYHPAALRAFRRMFKPDQAAR